MENLKKTIKETPPGRFGKFAAYSLLIGVGLGWMIFPIILDFILGKKLALIEGTDTRIIWKKLPPLVTKIYLFNITNSKEVQNGEIPVLDEIGPYCLLAYKEKIGLVDDEESDTVSYSQKSTWYWKSSPDCSQKLTGNEIIVQPNAFLLALLLKAKQDFPTPLLAVVNEALPAIYGKIKDIFLTAKARDLLFDGILINCTERNLLPRAICIAIKQNSKPLVQIAPNVYLFSYLGARNGTVEPYRYTVMRGVNNLLDIGRLVQIDGKTELPFWKGECNRLSGTDSTVFPPHRRQDNTSFTAYSSDLCRVIKGIYDGTDTYKGITGYKYRVTLGEGSRDPNQQCYCSKSSSCKKGILDADVCLGAPLVASFPHFFDASPELERGVTGLNPNKERHSTYAVLEPVSGVPLQARRRIQINIQLKTIRYVPITKKVKRTLCPLFWIEEGFDLDNNFVGMLQNQLLLGMTTMDAFKWCLIVIGSGLAGTSAYLYSKNKRKGLQKIGINQYDNEPNNTDISIIKVTNIDDILNCDDDVSDGTVTVVGAWSGPIKKRRLSRDSLLETGGLF
ncbi:sensory neuron membrane protein 1-like [Lycorma delicatula]|uniref:sensory neuron membrane protein 1-like n=1 Tax=Lycorma delicatula TaxID=130591 RepID=UPI003F515FDA